MTCKMTRLLFSLGEAIVVWPVLRLAYSQIASGVIRPGYGWIPMRPCRTIGAIFGNGFSTRPVCGNVVFGAHRHPRRSQSSTLPAPRTYGRTSTWNVAITSTASGGWTCSHLDAIPMGIARVNKSMDGKITMLWYYYSNVGGVRLTDNDHPGCNQIWWIARAGRNAWIWII